MKNGVIVNNLKFRKIQILVDRISKNSISGGSNFGKTNFAVDRISKNRIFSVSNYEKTNFLWIEHRKNEFSADGISKKRFFRWRKFRENEFSVDRILINILVYHTCIIVDLRIFAWGKYIVSSYRKKEISHHNLGNSW